jgi:hypothetical protein
MSAYRVSLNNNNNNKCVNKFLKQTTIRLISTSYLDLEFLKSHIIRGPGN